MEQGKIMEAEVPTVRVGATPTGLTAPHPHTSPRFLQAGCPSCCPTNIVKALKALQNQKLSGRLYIQSELNIKCRVKAV